MGQFVLQLSQEKIQQMKTYYEQKLVSVPQGAVFRAKTSGATITAYRSGKVLFQGKSPETEVEKWTAAETGELSYKTVAKKKGVLLPPDDLFSNSHIGTDEAGTGDYFGPITVAAAYVSKENIPLLKKIGVKDSKALTDDAIKRLAAAIIRMNVPNRVLILSNEKYNQLQKQGWSQGKMKGVLHQQAINELVEEIGESQLDGILIDQFCEPAVFKRYIVSESLSLQNNTYFMTKAESYSIAVATGSILARNAFLQEMEKLSEKVGMQLPKGASSMVDETIAKIIAAHGEAYLDACAKVHFANTKKGKRLL